MIVPNKPEEHAARFDYLKKLFSESNREGVRDYLNGVLRGPLVIDFDPTTACNFSCPECISADLLNQGKIPSDRIRSLLKEFKRAGARAIVFIGGGEPLAHSCMPEPLQQAHDLGLAVGLTTNGSLIGRYSDVIADSVSWTRVSMDAATSDTFLKVRPNKIPNSFEKIVNAMRELARKKRGALGYSFLVIQRMDESGYFTNVDEVFTAAQLAKDIGCDYFEYKPMFDMSHYLLSMNEAMQRELGKQREKCLTLKDEHFDIIAPDSVSHLAITETGTQKKDYHNCPTTEFRTVVTPSGVYPCAYHRGNEALRLSSVPDQPFDQYWNSDARRAASAAIDPVKHCGFFCARHKINLVLNNLERLKGDGVNLLPYIQESKVQDPFF